MAKTTSTGICMLCEKRYSRGGMGRHLRACRNRVGTQQVGGDLAGRPAKPSFHIAIQDRYNPHYWMHVEMAQDRKLADLDGFLRILWLECCGHLSGFYIEGVQYQSGDKDWFSSYGGQRTEDMGFAAKQVLGQGQRFTYEYDFGTTTELSLRVISELAPRPHRGIELLAINDPPALNCRACGKAKADEICTECAMEAFPDPGPGYLCRKCAARHACDDMIYLPVVNSPRVGMCGYIG